MKLLSFVILGLVASLSIQAVQPLVVSYATTHLNRIEQSVRGVVVTPGGQILTTEPMNPFDQRNIVIAVPEAGCYQAYFETLDTGMFRLCHFVGGISALLCENPEKPISFTPKESHIQVFPEGRKIELGSISQPISSFCLTSEDVE